MASFYRRRLSNPLKGYCSLCTSNDAMNFFKSISKGGLPVVTHLCLVFNAGDYDDYQDDVYTMALSRFHGKHALEEVRIIVEGNVLFTSDRYLLRSPAPACEPATIDRDGFITWRPVSQDLHAFIDGTIKREKIAKLKHCVHKYQKSVIDALLGIRGVPRVAIEGAMEHELRELLLATMYAKPSAARPPLSYTPWGLSNPRKLYDGFGSLLGWEEAPPQKLYDGNGNLVGIEDASRPYASSPPRTLRPQKRRKLRADGSGGRGRYVTDTEAGSSSDEDLDVSPTQLPRGRQRHRVDPAPTKEQYERASPDGRLSSSIFDLRQHQKARHGATPYRKRPRDSDQDSGTDANDDKRSSFEDKPSLEDDMSEPEMPHHDELRPQDMVVIAREEQTVQEFGNSEHWLENAGDWVLPTGGGARVELGWMVDASGQIVKHKGRAR